MWWAPHCWLCDMGVHVGHFGDLPRLPLFQGGRSRSGWTSLLHPLSSCTGIPTPQRTMADGESQKIPPLYQMGQGGLPALSLPLALSLWITRGQIRQPVGEAGCRPEAKRPSSHLAEPPVPVFMTDSLSPQSQLPSCSSSPHIPGTPPDTRLSQT